MVMHARKPQRISDGYDRTLDASVLHYIDGGRRQSAVIFVNVVNVFICFQVLRETSDPSVPGKHKPESYIR